MAGHKKGKSGRDKAARFLTAALVSLQLMLQLWTPALALEGSLAPGWNDDAIGDPDLVLEKTAEVKTEAPPVTVESKPELAVPVADESKPEQAVPVTDESKPEQAVPVTAESEPEEAASVADESKPEQAASVAAESKPEEAASVADESKPELAVPVADESKPEEAASVADESKPEEAASVTAESEPEQAASVTAESKPEESGATGGAEDGDELAFLEQGYVEKDSVEVIVIDNDEAAVVEETIAYEELPTDEAKTRIKTGAQFPVVMVSQISSKTSKKGDVLQARLKYDLKIGDRLIAKKGSLVTGHIDYNMPARTVLHSLVSPHRWYRNSGCVGIVFDEIINEKNEHIALNAKPARKDRIVKNKAEGRLLGVNHDGQITGPWGQQLRYKAVRIGLNAALAPAGVFSFGAMPVALGVMGAVNPSFAFMRPVGTNEPHRRIKGFAWGFLSGIPGSWIIEDTVTKGQEALIRPGDEFLVELHQEFTGEVLTEAQLIPGASAKISGDVDDERLEKTEKKGLFKLKKSKKK
ncbi:MAG: hypothetical protein IPM23_13410 [Candidatus Melainabacteria bacterium]|nr:hypothetical protein [Candidatus Melainabacteria bacterium]